MEPTQMTSGGVVETKKRYQLILVIILVVAVIAIGGGIAILRKPTAEAPSAPQGTPEEKDIIEKLKIAPVHEATPEEKATILKKLSAPVSKTPTEAERQKILELLKK